MSIESVVPSNHLILYCPLPLPPSVFPTIRVFSKESVLPIRWPKYWSSSFSISPSNNLDWFPLGLTDLIFLQSKGLSRVFSNTTIQKHQYLVVLSFLYGPTFTSIHESGRTIALTRGNFPGKVMSLLFNMLSRLVITFLPRSKCLFISWLQLLSTVFLEPKKIKSVTVSTFSPSICHEVMTRCHNSSFLNVEF